MDNVNAGHQIEISGGVDLHRLQDVKTFFQTVRISSRVLTKSVLPIDLSAPVRLMVDGVNMLSGRYGVRNGHYALKVEHMNQPPLLHPEDFEGATSGQYLGSLDMPAQAQSDLANAAKALAANLAEALPAIERLLTDGRPEYRLSGLWVMGQLHLPQLFREIVRICRQAGVLCALDNTWGAGLAFRPFELGDGLGVDISVQALTKYPSGGGDVLMGSIITRDAALHQRLHPRPSPELPRERPELDPVMHDQRRAS